MTIARFLEAADLLFSLSGGQEVCEGLNRLLEIDWWRHLDCFYPPNDVHNYSHDIAKIFCELLVKLKLPNRSGFPEAPTNIRLKVTGKKSKSSLRFDSMNPHRGCSPASVFTPTVARKPKRSCRSSRKGAESWRPSWRRSSARRNTACETCRVKTSG